jgi:hypothetical protein
VRKADNLTPSCAVVMKSGNHNFQESPGPLQVCDGTALALFITVWKVLNIVYIHLTVKLYETDTYTVPVTM